MVTIGEVH